jgi:hypothetical protein
LTRLPVVDRILFMQILFVSLFFVVCLALCAYMAYLAFTEANNPPAEAKKPVKPAPPPPLSLEEEEQARMAHTILEGIWAQADFDDSGYASGVYFGGTSDPVPVVETDRNGPDLGSNIMFVSEDDIKEAFKQLAEIKENNIVTGPDKKKKSAKKKKKSAKKKKTTKKKKP